MGVSKPVLDLDLLTWVISSYVVLKHINFRGDCWKRVKPTHHQTKAGWAPWAATLVARSQLLEGVSGSYFGSARGHASSLKPFIKHIIKLIFGYD